MASEISMTHEVHKISVNDVAYHCVGDVCVAVEKKTMVMKSALIKYSTIGYINAAFRKSDADPANSWV